MAPEDQSELALQILEGDVLLGPLNSVHKPNQHSGDQSDRNLDPERTLSDEPIA
jgi:hypothetical protein